MNILSQISMILLFALPMIGFAQEKAIEAVRDGNEYYLDEEYESAENAYREALKEDYKFIPGSFNLGNALFRQEKYKEAAALYESVANDSDERQKADAFHNLGNANLMNQELEKAIEAYKNALRTDPSDKETKYNLTFAQNLKKQQDQQQQKEEQNQENQENNEDKQDENKDKQDENQENKDDQNQDGQEDKKEEGEDEKNEQGENKENEDKKDKDQEEGDKQEEQKGDKEGQPKPEQGKMSREEALKLLEALQSEDQKVQDKMNKKGEKVIAVPSGKDW